MDKILPKVFANPIDKKIGNVQDTFYEGIRQDRHDFKTIERKINEIFSSKNFVYKSQVLITTKEGTALKTIVGRTGISLLDISGGVIPISSILDIEKK